MPKISGLPPAGTLADDDQLAMVDTSVTTTKKLSLANLVTFIRVKLQATANWLSASSIDFGGAGTGVWWEEIARTTLTSSAKRVTVTSIPSRKYIHILLSGVAAGGTIDSVVQFENDAATNYYVQYLSNGGAAPLPAVTNVPIEGGSVVDTAQTISEITLFSSIPGRYIGYLKTGAWIGGGSAPYEFTATFEYANAAKGTFSRIDWINNGSGNFGVGSEVIILGHD